MAKKKAVSKAKATTASAPKARRKKKATRKKPVTRAGSSSSAHRPPSGSDDEPAEEIPAEDLAHPDKPIATNKNRSRNRNKRAPVSSRPSQDELDERCYEVAMMLTRGAKKREIKAFCNQTWGITARSTESYIARAKEILRERREFSTAEDELNIALEYWLNLSNSTKLKPSERMAARDRYEKLILLQQTAERIHAESNPDETAGTLAGISGIGRPREQVIKEAHEALTLMQAAIIDARNHQSEDAAPVPE